jgi:hypothetical protein
MKTRRTIFRTNVGFTGKRRHGDRRRVDKWNVVAETAVDVLLSTSNTTVYTCTCDWQQLDAFTAVIGTDWTLQGKCHRSSI